MYLSVKEEQKIIRDSRPYSICKATTANHKAKFSKSFQRSYAYIA
jgi:hypothetical protein